jgi:hypothetical protein
MTLHNIKQHFKRKTFKRKTYAVSKYFSQDGSGDELRIALIQKLALGSLGFLFKERFVS